MFESNLNQYSKITGEDLEKLKLSLLEFCIYKQFLKNSINDEFIKEWFLSLSPWIAEVIIHSYGICGEKIKIDSQIAKIMDTSEKRVHRLRHTGINILIFPQNRQNALAERYKNQTKIKNSFDPAKTRFTPEEEKFNNIFLILVDKNEKQTIFKNLNYQLNRDYPLDDYEREILEMRFGLNDKSNYTRSEIAHWMGCSRSYIKFTEVKALKCILDKQNYSDEENVVYDQKKYHNFLNQIINNRSEKRKLEKPLSSEQEKDLNEFIDTLTDREKEIITLGFGLDGKEPLSFPVIGHKLNCSAERVRQIKNRIISKMPPQLNELFKQMDKSLHP